MQWYHAECAQIEKKFRNCGCNCSLCRETPNLVKQLLTKVSKIDDQMKHQSDTMMAFNDCLTQISNHNFLLVKTLQNQSREIQQLKEENWLLKDEIKKCIEEVRKTESVQPVINIPNVEVDPPEVTEQEKGSKNFQNEKQMDIVLLGDSTMKTETLSPFKSMKVDRYADCSKLQEVSEQIRHFTAPSVVIQCGADNVHDEPAFVTIIRMKRFEIILNHNKNIKNVFVSRLLPRSDSFDLNRKSELVNAAIELLCESNKWHYIDNNNIDLSFISKVGIAQPVMD